MSLFKKIKRKIYGVLGLSLSNIDYWELRSQQFGARSVLNINHSKEEMNAVTAYQMKEIFPHLKAALSKEDKIILDFGCGPGRFTTHLATLINGRAIGVDPISRFLQLAPKSANVEYKLLEKGIIPLADHQVDVVWICLVLGGIKEEDIGQVVSEIKRVLKPNGLIFLIENTTNKSSKKYWYFRSVKWYKDIFQPCKLRHEHDYLDLEQTISIISGRNTNGDK